jgi:hypothetical protein
VFGALFLGGAALRALTMYAYRPALEFDGDSYAYLKLSRQLDPDPIRPAGYPVFLKALSWTDALWLVPLLQHLAGLAAAVALYTLLVRRGLARPVAALAAAPVLLDAYQVALEHFIMAEALFAALLVAALYALLASPRPSAAACAVAGTCLAAASLMRTIGLVIAVLAVSHALLRRVGWLRVAVMGLALAAPLVAYASWYNAVNGRYALTGGDAVWFYGRVAPIADCARLDLAPEQLVLCSPHPPAERPGPNFYVWDRNSPRFRLPVPEEERDALLADFARQVATKQPGAYARVVAADFGHYFAPGRDTDFRDWPVGTWQFPAGDEPAYLHNNRPLHTFPGADPTEVYVRPHIDALRAYQKVGYLPGPALAATAALGLTAVFAGIGRPRLRPHPRIRVWLRIRRPNAAGVGGVRAPPAPPAGSAAERRRIAADCLLLVGIGVVVLAVPSATVCFDYRYLLPALLVFPPAAALGWRQAQLVLAARRDRRRDAPAPGGGAPGGPADVRPGPDITTPGIIVGMTGVDGPA